MKYFKNYTSDLNTSDEIVYCIEPINPVTINYVSDTDVILDSSDNKNLLSAPPISETNSKFSDTGPTVQTSSNSEKLNSFFKNSKTPTAAAQRPPISLIPLAPAIIPLNIPGTIHIPDPSDIDPPFPLPLPPLTKTVARKSDSFKHRKSIDAAFCDKQTTFALKIKIKEPSTSAKLPDLKTAYDICSETFSLLYLKISSSLYSTSSFDDFWDCES